MDDLQAIELQRYARHLAIPGFGLEAQRRLKAARVLIIGTGGLGSPAAMYLAAAGVGTLGLVDADLVSLSNLQRQLLHGTSDVGRPKLDSAAERIAEINPHVQVIKHAVYFEAANAVQIVADYDLIIDGTDNFPTRYLSNDVAVWRAIPNVYGSILRFDGQVSVFAPSRGGPCYRCMCPQPPAPGLVPSCAEGGVLGVLPGIVGSMQALEAIKLLCDLGEPLIGRLLHVDTLSMKFRSFGIKRDPDCAVCGTSPSITQPIDYAGFCGLPTPTMSDPSDSITVEQLNDLRRAEQPHILLDVREPFEIEIAQIEGSRRIPLAELPDRLAEIPKDQTIVIHCKMGGRSSRACEFLRQQGYAKVINVEGGINAWSQRIDSSVSQY